MKVLLERRGTTWSAHVLDLDVVTEGVDVWHAIAMAYEAAALVLEWDAEEGLDPRRRAARTPPEAWVGFEGAMLRMPWRLVRDVAALEVIKMPRAPGYRWLLRGGHAVPEGALRIAGFDIEYVALHESPHMVDFHIWRKAAS